MNQRDINRIAKSLNGAFRGAFYSASPTSAWYVCVASVAQALGDDNPSFDRAAFMAECRANQPVETKVRKAPVPQDDSLEAELDRDEETA